MHAFILFRRVVHVYSAEILAWCSQAPAAISAAPSQCNPWTAVSGPHMVRRRAEAGWIQSNRSILPASYLILSGFVWLYWKKPCKDSVVLLKVYCRSVAIVDDNRCYSLSYADCYIQQVCVMRIWDYFTFADTSWLNYGGVFWLHFIFAPKQSFCSFE